MPISLMNPINFMAKKIKVSFFLDLLKYMPIAISGISALM